MTPPQEPVRRRAVPPGGQDGPRLERSGQMWRIRSLETARQVLRARDATVQAGFTAEQIPRGIFRRHPILISDGALHDEQRRSLARLFAPAKVPDRYGSLIEERAERAIASAVARGEVRLDELALHYAVAVTAEVVGLTASPVPAMARRLEAFFRQPPADYSKPRYGRTRRQQMLAAQRGLLPVLRLYLADVRPALREHRRRQQDDVIGHLLAEGASTADVLVECVTYGTAGMVTTREFIAMACWHLLEHPRLAARYLEAGETERFAILEEILRLEPVVGHLYRRVQAPLTVHDSDTAHELRPGDLVDVDVRAANLDPEAVGDDPGDLCPHRELPRGVAASGLAFGDGAHRCPGAPLALRQTDALLRRLLAAQPELLRAPDIGWDDVIAGYALRDLRIGFPGR